MTKLKRLRRKAGLTQRQLGELAGLSYSYIRAMEAGRYSPSVRSIAAVSRVLAKKLGQNQREIICLLAVDAAKGGAKTKNR